MKVAFGTKAHSGWAVLVVVGMRDGIAVINRRRLALASEGWEKAPYHAAEPLERDAASKLVERAIANAHERAARALQAAVEQEQAQDRDVVGCGVLVLDPMPAWSVEEILAVHFRMHKAEGTLFREALLRAAGKCGVRAVAVHEKRLVSEAAAALRTGLEGVEKTLATLGKAIGPPWGKDQKDAALAAIVALLQHAT